jgi:hypothetical protein
VLEYSLVPTEPGRVAAVDVYLARVTLGACDGTAAGGRWSVTLAHCTWYGVGDLEGPVLLMHRLQEPAEDDATSSLFNKHKGGKCGQVALKTVVCEADLGFV